jgi:hypothetical protein
MIAPGKKNGADIQIRTGDLTLTKGALYQLSHIGSLFELERVAGIEPASSAWKAEVLPLYHTRCIGLASLQTLFFTTNKTAYQVFT